MTGGSIVSRLLLFAAPFFIQKTGGRNYDCHKKGVRKHLCRCDVLSNNLYLWDLSVPGAMILPLLIQSENG